jgi:peptidoglycan/xylan/chitin deacetylase (PgdA/CDA1 family)
LRETSAPPPGSPLADFGAGGATEAAARRALHGLRVPPPLVAAAAQLLGEERARRLRAPIGRYAYWHGARAALDRQTWRRLSQGTAILMYHAIGAPGEGGTRFVVPARRLRRQLLLLRWSRRPVIGLADLVRSRQAGELSPAGAVVITFDDGFADTGELAAPLLRSFGTPATLFVVSDRVGGAADWDGAGELASRPLANWSTLAEMARDGIEIGAHTRTHPRLPELGPGRAADEIAGAREVLSSRLGTEVRAFCYPYGRKTRDVVRIVEDSGFACACGVERGLNYAATPLHELRRVPVDGDASTLRFLLGVRFGDPDLLLRLVGRLRGRRAHARARGVRPEVDSR